MADEKLHNYTQHTFEKAWKDMIVKSTQSWNDLNSRFVYVKPIRDYSEEEIGKIINSGSIVAQQELSYNYFMKDGLYRRLILYYATLLTYAGLLIPNPTFGNELSTPYIRKRFENALDYVDKFFNSKLLTHKKHKHHEDYQRCHRSRRHRHHDGQLQNQAGEPL